MNNEWTNEELAQMGSLMRLRERRKMEELHNTIVDVMVQQKATPQASLMVLKLLEQEIVNDYMIKLFAPKKPEAATGPPVPKDVKPPGEVKEEAAKGPEEAPKSEQSEQETAAPKPEDKSKGKKE